MIVNMTKAEKILFDKIRPLLEDDRFGCDEALTLERDELVEKIVRIAIDELTVDNPLRQQ